MGWDGAICVNQPDDGVVGGVMGLEARGMGAWRWEAGPSPFFGVRGVSLRSFYCAKSPRARPLALWCWFDLVEVGGVGGVE